MNNDLPRIVITPGDPSGIGLDLCIQLVQEPLFSKLASYDLTIVSDPELLEARAHHLGVPINIVDSQTKQNTGTKIAGDIHVTPVKLGSKVIPGQTNPANTEYVLSTLKTATQGCLSGLYNAMVTGPVHKGVINDAGVPFTGHTEYLAGICKADHVVMMLCIPGLRVALATTHVPIAQVSHTITHELLEQTFHIICQDLRRFFAIKNPRMLACGLNPHAGENGHLGREEIDTIIPVIKELQHKGFNIRGPVPADTAFTKDSIQQADVILTMYHDQGLPVLKHIGFGNAVNVTLGLPIIRTSVDHGTALELAGTGKARADSLVAAIHTAATMIECST